MNKPDFTDVFVYNMCARNHLPIEAWDINGELISVQCETCLHAWPCPTRKELNKRSMYGTLDTHSSVEMISMPISEWKELVKSYEELSNDLTALKCRMQEIKEEIANNESRKKGNK